MARRGGWSGWCLLAVACALPAADDYTFDITQYEKKAFELGGYAEGRWDHFALDRQSALYQLNFFDRPERDRFARSAGAIQLEGLYRRDIASFRFLGVGSYLHDYAQSETDARAYEAYLSLAPSDRITADIGKKTLRWGKGYAWNPVGFVERPKDPNDPDLAREGFVIAGGDFVRSFGGALRTAALTPLIVPTAGELNGDFGEPDHVNPAVKLYLLYRDTDIDFMLLGAGSRSARYGVDLSRNLDTNFEIHGEWAHITEAERPVVDSAGGVTRVAASANTWLLGVRHLSARDVTTILEYYYNGAGYTEDQMRDFAAAVHGAYEVFQATGDPIPLARLNAVLPAYARPSPGRRYLFLRVGQKEPFDILYFTPGVTVIANVDDGSYSVAPELLYTAITNFELRVRLFWLRGGRLTDFGEKQNDRRLELRVRYFF